MDEHIIITIGRQFGSGGKGVANIISKKLGIPVYDSEILAESAQESGFSKELFERSDERKNLFSLASIFGANRYGGANSSGISDNDLFRIQGEVIRRIAKKGSAIFVGRASDYVLRDLDTLDVFLCAPMEVRRRIVAAREGMTENEAEVFINKKERRRREYYNYLTFGDNWGVASNYDLCIDSSILGLDETADLIITFARKKGLLK